MLQYMLTQHPSKHSASCCWRSGCLLLPCTGGEYGGYESDAEVDYDRLSYEVRPPRVPTQQLSDHYH